MHADTIKNVAIALALGLLAIWIANHVGFVGKLVSK